MQTMKRNPYLRKLRQIISKASIGLRGGSRGNPKSGNAVIHLEPSQPTRGNILISYIIAPFLQKPGDDIDRSRSHFFMSSQMANSCLDLGYSVDFIDWTNVSFIPEKDYVACIDVRHNLERLAPLLNPGCKKIFFIDVANTAFTSWIEMGRVLEIQRIRGITLQPRRCERPNHGIETAECAIGLGNDSTLGTFSYADKPIFRVPNPGMVHHPEPLSKDFDACRRHFVWFGSYGAVAKGLDLVLEAFRDMPDYRLTVCGPIEKEADFVAAYRAELYETDNIRTLGWLSNQDSSFTDLVDSAVGCIYTSFVEGQSGSVIDCLHAGLIPIISRESGVDIPEEAGITVEASTAEHIRRAVARLSDLPADTLRAMARQSWRLAQERHTAEQFRLGFESAMRTILEEPEKQQDPENRRKTESSLSNPSAAPIGK